MYNYQPRRYITEKIILIKEEVLQIIPLSIFSTRLVRNSMQIHCYDMEFITLPFLYMYHNVLNTTQGLFVDHNIDEHKTYQPTGLANDFEKKYFFSRLISIDFVDALLNHFF